MKLYFSLSHNSFPEFSELPKGKAERHFFYAAREFYYSADGFKAASITVLCGAAGLLSGIFFGPVLAAIGAGLGIYWGCVLFNSLMHAHVSSKLQQEQKKKVQLTEPVLAKNSTLPKQIPSSQATTKRPSGFKFSP